MDSKPRLPALSLPTPPLNPLATQKKQAQPAIIASLRRDRHRNGQVKRRPDYLTEIIVQVGISLADSGGMRSGMAFLLENDVDQIVIARVLFEPHRRRLRDAFVIAWEKM